MSTYYKYAQFVSCTPLSSAEMDFTFDLTWTLPDTDIYSYDKIEIYRYIGDLNTGITNPTETDVHSKLIYTNLAPVIGSFVYSDDLSIYNNSNTTLRNNHTLSGSNTDAEVLTEIFDTKRVIYYLILTYVIGNSVAIPYCVGSHLYNNIIDNTSTKTQVQNDTLHFEGDIIWATKIKDANTMINRTSIDLKNNLLWVSESKQGYIYKLDLSTGLQLERFTNTQQLAENIQGSGNNGGHAIAALDDSSCLSLNMAQSWGTYGYTLHQTGKLIKCNSGANGDENTTSNNLTIINAACPTFGWGMTRISNNPYAVAVTPNNVDDNDYGVISVANGTFTRPYPSQYGSVYGSGFGGYAWGVCSGPDSNVFFTKHDPLVIVTLSATLPYNFYNNVTYPTIIPHYTAIADNYNMWPNQSNSVNKYHLIACGEASTGKIEDFVIDSTKNFSYSIGAGAIRSSTAHQVITTPSISGSFQCVGIDGQNNIWGLGSNRVEVTRMENTSAFPFGGICRYPTVTIDEQPFNSNNTPQIEWFLLLDSGYENSTMGVTAYGQLDHTTTSLFKGHNYTAHQAWWSLVDDNRFEVNPSGAFPSTRGFDVLKYTTGLPSAYTRGYGIKIKPTTTIADIELWYTTYGSISNNLVTRRVKPWYGTTDGIILSAYKNNLVNHAVNTYKPGSIIGDNTTTSQTIIFKSWFGDSFPYSDFTGNYLTGQNSSLLNKDLINPTPTDPTFPPNTFHFDLTGYQDNSGYQDVNSYCYPWKNTASDSSGLSGYDNFTINGTVLVNTGTYAISQIKFYTDDYDGHVDTISKQNNIFSIGHTYNDSSKMGLYYLPSGNPSVSEYLHDKKTGGAFTPYVYLSALDIYNNTILTATASTNIVVLERWPEAKFYFDATDLTANRRIVFTNNTWGYDRFDKSTSIRKESRSSDAKRYDTTYGVDSISGILRDRSIARTYPISSWNITLSTNNPYVSWYNTGTAITLTQNGTALNIGADEQNFYDELKRFNFRYGDYKVTMNVAASSTATSGDKIFTNYIQVDEFEPFANFWAISGYTVSPNYTNDSPTSASAITGTFPNGNNAIYPFVSGYAPNMTVYFQDSSEAHTFPIGKYNWNFGDYYNEGTVNVYATDSNYYTVTTNNIQSGTFDNPNWKTDVTAHTAVHTYTMPGTYDVTLTVTASTTNTTDLCARYTGTDTVKKFNVYVQEIPPMFIEGIKASDSPICSATTDFSGISPKTYYFCGSGILAGSFPICKMVWDFGDGTTETITRTPSSIVTKQGLSMTYHTDPRFTIVPHIYNNNTVDGQTYSIGVSTYSCNTNTMIVTGVSNLIGPLSNAYVNHEEKRKLIGSRFDSDGNMVYVFEGLTTKNTYTVVMSGVI